MDVIRIVGCSELFVLVSPTESRRALTSSRVWCGWAEIPVGTKSQPRVAAITARFTITSRVLLSPARHLEKKREGVQIT